MWHFERGGYCLGLLRGAGRGKGRVGDEVLVEGVGLGEDVCSGGEVQQWFMAVWGRGRGRIKWKKAEDMRGSIPDFIVVVLEVLDCFFESFLRFLVRVVGSEAVGGVNGRC